MNKNQQLRIVIGEKDIEIYLNSKFYAKFPLPESLILEDKITIQKELSNHFSKQLQNEKNFEKKLNDLELTFNS